MDTANSIKGECQLCLHTESYYYNIVLGIIDDYGLIQIIKTLK